MGKKMKVGNAGTTSKSESEWRKLFDKVEHLCVSDAQLVTLVGRYSAPALAEIYRRHGGAVNALALIILNNTSEADDVTQLVFLRLWHSPDRYDPTRESLRCFLLYDSNVQAVDLVRSMSSRRPREAKDTHRSTAQPCHLHHQFRDPTMADDVKRALSLLPLEEREAIELASFHSSYVKAAKILFQSEEIIKSRIRNGMRRMCTFVDAGVKGSDG